MQSKTSAATSEFVAMASCIMRSKGNPIAASRYAENSPYASLRVENILKAAVASGSLSDPAWAGSLADHETVTRSFIDAMRHFSVFDRLLQDGMHRIPLRTRVIAATTGARGSTVAEGAPKPVTRLTLSQALSLEPIKSTALLVQSEELANFSSPGGQALLTRELQAGVAATTDANFLSTLAGTAPEFASAGSTAANVLTDLDTLLASVNPASMSRLFLVTDPTTARGLATKPATDGRTAFPLMTPLGGEIIGIPVLVTDQFATDSSGSRTMMIDATCIAGETGTIALSGSTQSSIQMNDAPTDGGTPMVSLFQTNCVALMATRYYGFKQIRSYGVAVLTGVSY